MTRRLALATMFSLTAALPGALAQTAGTPQAAPGTTQPSTPSVATPAAPNPGAGAGAGSGASMVRQLTVDALEDMHLVASDGTTIGDIEGVVENNADKKQFVIVERGGLMGFFTKELAIPTENLAVQGDKVVLRNMEVARLEQMPEYTNENGAYRELDDVQQIGLTEQ